MSYLVAQDVPYAVTRQQNEFPVFTDSPANDVRTPGHDLVFRAEVGVLLEGEVADCTAESQVAVHSVQLHETAGVLDAGLSKTKSIICRNALRDH